MRSSGLTPPRCAQSSSVTGRCRRRMGCRAACTGTSDSAQQPAGQSLASRSVQCADDSADAGMLRAEPDRTRGDDGTPDADRPAGRARLGVSSRALRSSRPGHPGSHRRPLSQRRGQRTFSIRAIAPAPVPARAELGDGHLRARHQPSSSGHILTRCWAASRTSWASTSVCSRRSGRFRQALDCCQDRCQEPAKHLTWSDGPGTAASTGN